MLVCFSLLEVNSINKYYTINIIRWRHLQWSIPTVFLEVGFLLTRSKLKLLLLMQIKCDQKNYFKNQGIFHLLWLICYTFFPRYLLV